MREFGKPPDPADASARGNIDGLFPSNRIESTRVPAGVVRPHARTGGHDSFRLYLLGRKDGTVDLTSPIIGFRCHGGVHAAGPAAPRKLLSHSSLLPSNLEWYSRRT